MLVSIPAPQGDQHVDSPAAMPTIRPSTPQFVSQTRLALMSGSPAPLIGPQVDDDGAVIALGACEVRGGRVGAVTMYASSSIDKY
jgi:hypothetical protein